MSFLYEKAIDDINGLYEIKKQIGKGSFGQVFLGIDRNDGKQYAIKFIMTPIDDQNKLKSLLRELQIMGTLKHPSTLRLICFQLPQGTQTGPTIVTNLMSNGTLEEVMKKKHIPPEWSPTKCTLCLFGIASTMAYLHKNHVLHRDLKPANVFLNEECEPVIADFGLSKINEGKALLQTICGSPIYMAPEIFEGEDEYDCPVDVYAYAVTIYQFFSHKAEFDVNGKKILPKSQNDLINFVTNGYRMVKPKGAPEKIWELICACWANTPNDRPSFAQIVDLLLNDDEIVFPETDMDEYHKYQQRMLLYQNKIERPPVVNNPINTPNEDEDVEFSFT